MSGPASRVSLIALAIQALAVPRYKVTNEEELQAAIAGELFERGVPFLREWALSGQAGRIDFLLGHDTGAGVGLEVKIGGTTAALYEQLRRYAGSSQIPHLIVATTRRKHRNLPDLIAGVPVEVVHLRAAL